MTTAPTERPGDGGPWIPQVDTFGARLALVRQAVGFTNVAEAALACGLPVQSWRNWEQGKIPRDIVSVTAKIAARTGVDQAWLAGFPQPPRGTAVIACSPRFPGQRHETHSLPTVLVSAA